MDDLIGIVFILGFLLFLVALMTAIGHGIWLLAAAFVSQLSGFYKKSAPLRPPENWYCLNCNFEMLSARADFCGACGTPRPSSIVVELLKDLAATERQVERFHRSGTFDEKTYIELKTQIDAERTRLNSRHGPRPRSSEPQTATSAARKVEDTPVSVTAEPTPAAAYTSPPPSVVTATLTASDDQIVIEPVPSFLSQQEQQSKTSGPPAEPVSTTFTPRPPRKSFSEVLNAFMEESNIRWGEIIGGLLIIGCSTALVVSLWAEISSIPVLKFLIFTTVTAVLFGIGLYTEHRWKLPTTSRGILTIATLLVPLNFLAIAAVSSSTIPSGALVIGSELVAPAVFLCLVYFAGRVITPDCAHLLSAGVLGSSVGQLLVRHFASPEVSPLLLVVLGAFPIVCYVLTVGLALRVALADHEIDESEVTTVFTMLGTMTFAALLPFGLLLYKAGPIGMTMMYLAPLVTLAGLPLLATGTVLWRRINDKKLVASRTVGTSLGILGVVVVLAGMFLAWPNPASIVPAALLNFAALTALAVLLDLPVAHLPAAFCFGLAYLVLFHVLAGNISWRNLRVASLLDLAVSLSSGQALVGLFAILLIASEWLTRIKRRFESSYYLVAACSIGFLSLVLVSVPVLMGTSGPRALCLIYGFYALGAFWIAWTRKLGTFSWVGSALLLVAFAQGFAQPLAVSFPWQTAFLTHATVCAIAAILSSRHDTRGIVSTPLNYSALLVSGFAVISFFQANPWEITSMQAARAFWLTGIWFLLLWPNRRKDLFTLCQISLTCAVMLSIKAMLQQYEWYAFLPHAWLHPWALQIQGTVLVLLSLGWIAMRLGVRRALSRSGNAAGDDGSRDRQHSWLADASELLESRFSVDRFISWGILGGFLLVAIYGAFPGLTAELAARGSDYSGWDIAGFPHQIALGLGSWILLGLVAITMLANLWDRRRAIYVLGALAALSTAVPLLAGRFENEIATASAWRWLSALFLLAASVVLWSRKKLREKLQTSGWPELNIDAEELVSQTRTLLLVLTVAPIVLLTIYPALRAIYYLPVQGPAAGIFAFLDDDFSYGVPLVLVALVLISYAIRDRIVDYAFFAGLFFNATLTIVYLLSVVAVGGSMNRVVLARAVQLNAVTFGLYALVWLVTHRRWQGSLGQSQARAADQLLNVQVGMAVGLNALLIVPVTLRLILSPESAGIGTFTSGSYSGWLALVVALVATYWLVNGSGKKFSAGALATTLLAVSCLMAFSFASWNVATWSGLDSLTVGATVTAWLMFIAGSLRPARSKSSIFDISNNWQSLCRGSAALVGGIAVLLSLRIQAGAVASAWWSIVPLLAISALAGALNWQTLRRGYLYAAAILLNIAVTIWWAEYLSPEFFAPAIFLEINVIAVCLASILWLWLELRARRLRGDEARSTFFSVHNVAALGSLLILVVIVSLGFSFESGPLWFLQSQLGTTWLALASLVALMAACMWDQRARYPVAGLYVLGLTIGAMALNEFDLGYTSQLWTAGIFLATYALVASLTWRWRGRLIDMVRQLNMPQRIDPATTELAWLSAFNIVAVAAVGFIAYWIVLRFVDFNLRATAAIAVAAQSLTFALLAEGRLRERWQRTAIGMFMVGAVLFGWSWLVPGVTGTWLNRSVILMVETFAFTVLYGIELNRVRRSQPAWTEAARFCVPWILGAGVIALFFCLGTEVFYQINFGTVRIKPLSLGTIGLTLAVSVVISVLFALSPKHDPLSLSERGRMKYVYVAEAMLALLFLHIRLTMPWLFSGFFERYWPIAVIAIAYLGVVTSEALRRRKLLVLAQPLERTGAFLPLLPVLGFWLAQSKVDYSVLLFAVGGLYGLLSLLRRSFAFGALAAIAGNSGLWYVWQRSADYQFLQHPQLWLIPVALSVLLAAYLNEDDFTEDQMAAIRYLALVTIYASSTADIFINGVATSPWLPLLLGAFSLAGVFSGIIFRIRGLLLLGSVFLLLAIITMIWYASANLGWTWLWYVAGIVTGATIIFMFAVFEKKRGDVLRVVEGLKEWDR